MIEPADKSALAEAVVSLLENQDERERLSIDGIQHAAKFSWEKTAKLTLAVYEDLLANREV